MAIMEITIIPVTGSPSVSKYVAEAIKLIRESGLKFELTPTSTVIEGNIDELFHMAKKIHLLPLEKGAPRNLTLIKIDDRRDKNITMEYKKKSVIEKI